MSAVCVYEGGASMDPASAASMRAAARRDALLASFEGGTAFLGSLEAVEAGYEEPEERWARGRGPCVPLCGRVWV